MTIFIRVSNGVNPVVKLQVLGYRSCLRLGCQNGEVVGSGVSNAEVVVVVDDEATIPK